MSRFICGLVSRLLWLGRRLWLILRYDVFFLLASASLHIVFLDRWSLPDGLVLKFLWGVLEFYDFLPQKFSNRLVLTFYGVFGWDATTFVIRLSDGSFLLLSSGFFWFSAMFLWFCSHLIFDTLPIIIRFSALFSPPLVTTPAVLATALSSPASLAPEKAPLKFAGL